MRGIALTALAAATIAPADSAAAQTVHWSAVVRVERWVSDGGSEFFGYWRSVFGSLRGPREFEYDGAPYTVRLFYITNEPRSLLVGLEKRGRISVKTGLVGNRGVRCSITPDSTRPRGPALSRGRRGGNPVCRRCPG